MTPEQAIDLIRSTLFVTTEISLPILAVIMVVGLIVSIFQSVTQITEITLIFIPKLVCCAIAFALVFPWMLKVLVRYTYDLLITHWNTIIYSIN